MSVVSRESVAEDRRARESGGDGYAMSRDEALDGGRAWVVCLGRKERERDLESWRPLCAFSSQFCMRVVRSLTEEWVALAAISEFGWERYIQDLD
jgi:hypothetical protein